MELSDVTTNCVAQQCVLQCLALATGQCSLLSTLPPDRTKASYGSLCPFTAHRGGMWPCGAHVILLNKGFMLHGGCSHHALHSGPIPSLAVWTVTPSQTLSVCIGMSLCQGTR